MGWGGLIFLGIGVHRSLQQAGKLEWTKIALGATVFFDPLGGLLLSAYYLNELTGAGKAESPTYSQTTPQLTAASGTPVPFANGLCFLSGNIVRQNDFEEDTDYIKLLVDFGEGVWDQVLGVYINDVEWSELKEDRHTKVFFMGTAGQGAINTLFPDDACAFRNHVIGEFRLKKGDEIATINNITVVARTRQCLNIGQNIGGTSSFTRNPAQILWDTYLKRKGADYTTEMMPHLNDWYSLYNYCAESLCHTDKTYYQVNVPAPAGDLVKSTTTRKGRHAKYVVDLDMPVTGSSKEKSAWQANAGSQQRLNLDFGRRVVLTRFQLSNYHNAGKDTGLGVRNFAIQGSNNVASFNNTAYSSTTGWANVQTGLVATQHPATDTPFWQTFNLPGNTTGYRYYSFRVADNWGGGSAMGIRQLRFFTGNAPSACTGDETNIRYAFDFNHDTKIPVNDYEKEIWKSFDGMVIRSQGAYKPVWNGAQEPNGGGGLRNKVSRYTFVVGENTHEKSLTWHRVDKQNVFRRSFRDSSNKFKECPDAEYKNDEDVALRGEDTNDDEYRWCIDSCVAARRVKREYNKNQYADYITGLTGFPSSQALELYDRVTVTAENAGWAGKDYIIRDKNEDSYGRCQYVLEAYLSGVYDDKGFELQPGYATRAVNPKEPLPSVDPLRIVLANTIADATKKYSNGAIRITWDLPASGTYHHTNIYVSTDDVNYFLAAQDSTGDAYIDGLGKYWDYGDTVYVRLQNVTITGVKNVLSDTYDGFVVVGQNTKMAGFYAGENDLWGGNPALNHAGTLIVIGGLDGTPKIALGATADSIAIDNIATYPGFFADPTHFRVGNTDHFLRWDTTLSWKGANTSLTSDGLFTAANANITGAITATSGAIANFTIAANSLTTLLLGLHSASYGEGAEILLGHATSYAGAKIGLRADGSGKLASGKWSWDTSGNITSTGNIELTAGYLRAGGASNYTAMTPNGFLAVSSTLGTTVNIPQNGSAPTFSSGIIKEMVYEIYTSGVIRTNANPAANGGMIINNTEMKGYNASGILMFRSVWGGVDQGDFYAGNFAGGAAGLSYDHSAATLNIAGNLKVLYGGDITLYGNAVEAWPLPPEHDNAKLIFTDSLAIGSVECFASYQYIGAGYQEFQILADPVNKWNLLADRFKNITLQASNDVTLGLNIGGGTGWGRGGHVRLWNSNTWPYFEIVLRHDDNYFWYFLNGAENNIPGNLSLGGDRIDLSTTCKVITGSKTVLNDTVTGIFEVAIPVNTSVGVSVSYTARTISGAGLEVTTGECLIVGINDAGAITSAIENDRKVNLSSLGSAWSVLNGAGKITVRVLLLTVKPSPSISLTYNITLNGNETVTKL